VNGEATGSGPSDPSKRSSALFEPSEPSTPPEQEDRPLDAEKLLRLASLAGQVLEEARQMDAADESTARGLAALHGRVTSQLYEALPNSLVEELKAMDLHQPFADGATGQEVRLAYAGLIGWLGGLLQGLQAAMQMAHMQQLQQARQTAAIPPPGPTSATGQYL
jgi:proteasome activator-like protein